MKYLIAYKIGLVVFCIIFLFAPPVEIKSNGELILAWLFRLFVFPITIGLAIMYVAKKL